MAKVSDRTVEIHIRASDETRGAVESARRNLNNFGKENVSLTDRMKSNWLGVAAAIGGLYVAYRGVKTVLSAVIASGLESQRVWGDVAASLSRHNEVVGQALPLVQEFASRMQTLTGVSDELVGTAFQRFMDANFGVQESLKLTQSALDISVAKDMDLVSAAELMAKSIDSSTNALKRYGIEIDKTGPRQQQISQLQAEINERFGGAAAARMETTAGKIELLGQRWDDFKESLFVVLEPGITEGLKELTGLLGLLSSATEKLRPLPADLLPGELIREINDPGPHKFFEMLWHMWSPESPDPIDPNLITRNNAAFRQLSDTIADMTSPAKVEALRQMMTIFTPAGMPKIRPAERTLADRLTEDLELEADLRTKATIDLENRLAEIRDAWAQRKAAERSADLENERQLADLKLETVQNSLGSMAQALKTFSDIQEDYSGAAFIAFKAFAVAEAIIDAHRAFGRALASLPPPWSYAAAAAIFATAMSRVYAILATNPNRGAVVAAAPAPLAPAEIPTTAPAAPSGPQIINIYVSGSIVNQDGLARELIPALRKAINDGVRA